MLSFVKNGMGCFVRGDKNGMGCFVRGGKSMRDVLSGESKMALDVLSRDVLSYILARPVLCSKRRKVRISFCLKFP